MDLPISPKDLYQAYAPTVMRDIIYGIVRNKVSAILMGRNPEWANTNAGRFVNMFFTVMAACVISAPGNEFRGYCLQPPAKAQPFAQFFQPEKFIRSTTVGALIMSISLGVGTLATPQVEKLVTKLREVLKGNPAGYLLPILLIVAYVLQQQRKDEKGLENKKA